MADTASTEGWLAEASDPTTLAARLGELARLARVQARPEVTRAIAGNPNAPLPLLQQLSHEHAAEVLHNPSLPLYLLENPLDFFRPTLGIQALLSCDPVPSWFFEALLAYWNGDEDSFQMRRIGEWLARHPSTPASSLWALCLSINPEARAAAAVRGELPQEKLAPLVQAGSDPSLRNRSRRRPPIPEDQLRQVAAMGYWGAELAASHPKAPPGLLEQLARDPRPTIVAEVAENPCAPPGLLEQLAAHPSYIVRRKTARNPTASEAALAALARSNEPDVVRLALQHEHAPPELIRGFASNRSFSGTLAASARTPPELLAGYVQDTSIYVRRQAARNPATPPEALEALAQDPRYEVRLSALLNPRLPAAWVERLRNDRSREVRARAERRLEKIRARACEAGRGERLAQGRDAS